MRVPFALLALSLMAGCAGEVGDYVGPRTTILSPQLIRYGFDLAHTRCVSERLATDLTTRQLRRFAAAAGTVTQGYFDPNRLDARDLAWVAASIEDQRIRQALASANAACGVDVDVTPPPVAVEAPPAPAARAAAWLNLGAAGTGQSIAVDAATIEQGETTRSAWFRLTDPGAQPSLDIFHLVIDCPGRTINATERRRLDAGGAVAEQRSYPDNPLPVEEGTVMQIAYLSLCT